MAKKRVTLMLRVRTADGKYPFLVPVYSGKGRLRPLFALVNGKPEHHPEGVYHLRYSLGGKRMWEPVGKDPNEAIAAKLRREHMMQSKRLGLQTVGPERENRVKLADAIEQYLVRVRLHRSHKTQNEFDLMLPQFAETCGKTYLDEITGEDLLMFIVELRKRGLADRTIANRFARVSCFLKKNGIAGLLEAHERPRYDEKVVEAYNESELTALFKAATKEEELIFRFFLGSGCREAEVSYATWKDINFADRTFTVHSKRKQGFGPKDRSERTVPLPDSLVEALKAHRLRSQSHTLFPNKQGGPQGHFLRILKRLALRAGLHCGECVNKNGLSCRDGAVCNRWELHKFRRSFATLHHESGVSARTMQAWLGHSDLATTLAYLAIADMRSERVRQQVNNTFAVFT